MKSKYVKLSLLNKQIAEIIKKYKLQEFPIELNYQEGMEHSLFVITIQKKDSDVFVDALGKKWKRVEEEEEDDV